MSSNLKVNSLVPATGTEIGIGTTGGSIDFRCAATFGGNVTIGGTLTYDEVINIDSIGIVTARSGLNVQAGQLDVGSNIKLGNAGVVTATSLDISGDIDVDGHTNLDNVNVAGIVTVSSDGINAGILNLKTGNALRLRFSSGGTAQFRGDVDPIASFDRGSANSTNVKWGYLGADRGIISSISNEFRITASGTIPMTFHSNGSERLRIVSTGEVSIGNFTPTAGAGILQIGGGLRVAGSGAANDTTTPYIYRTSGVDNLNFATSGSERLRITSGGKIEVRGTRAGSLQASDDDTLQLYTASTNNNIDRGAGITFYNHDNSGYEMGGTIQVAKENGTADNVAAYMRFSTRPAGGSATERLRITSAGNLEIKKPPLNTATITTTNCLQLGLRLTSGGTGSNTEGHIYNGIAVGDGYAGLYGKDGGSSAATDLEFFTGTASAVAGRMRIQDDGKIIIGGNVSQSINRSVTVVAAQGNTQAVEIGLQPTNSSGGYNPEVYISSVSDGTYGAQMGFHTRNTSGARAERFGISSSGNIKWRNGAVLQRKTSAYLSIASAGTSDVKISGNFEANDILRVRWAYNWNAGDGGAWGEAVIWKMYESSVKVRYLTDVKASPLTSVSFPHSGNDIWLRWTTNAGINGYYMIDVESAGCEPFPF